MSFLLSIERDSELGFHNPHSELVTSRREFLTRTGTGFGIGFGRAGAAMGPALAGILFARGFDVAAVSLIISIGSAFSIIAILLVRLNSSARPA